MFINLDRNCHNSSPTITAQLRGFNQPYSSSKKLKPFMAVPPQALSNVKKAK